MPDLEEDGRGLLDGAAVRYAGLDNRVWSSIDALTLAYTARYTGRSTLIVARIQDVCQSLSVHGGK